MIKKEKKKSKPYNVEKAFISKLVETRDMKTLKDTQIKSTFFTGENKRVFIFIQDTFKSSGEVPTPRVLEQKFPSFSLETHVVGGREIVGTDETLAFWCNEVRTKAKHNKLAEITEELATKLDSGDTEEAYTYMKKGVWFIESEIVESTSVDITKNTEDRKLAYLEKKKNKGMMGIPSGIPQLDNLLKGFADETLTTIMAKSGLGKAWVLVLFACYAQLQGYKVCLFLTEMSAEIMQDRCEAMLFGMMYGNFNYNNFKSGCLDMKTEEKYFEFLEEDLPNLEPMILETATGVSSVIAVMEREKPDIVFIDSAYLMEDEQGAKEDWARITHITRDLKKVAKTRHKPIVINMQSDLNASDKQGISLKDVKYSQAIIQDSDNVIGLYRDEIMFADKEMGMKLLKQREGILGKVVTNWDFEVMNFSGIYSDNENNYDTSNTDDSPTTIEVE